MWSDSLIKAIEKDKIVKYCYYGVNMIGLPVLFICLRNGEDIIVPNINSDALYEVCLTALKSYKIELRLKKLERIIEKN